MDSSAALWAARSTPRRVSQDPRFVCRRAPFPITPSSPMRASAHYFRTGRRLQHLREHGRCYWFHEAESDSRTLGSRLRSPRPSSVGRPAADLPDRSVSRRRLPSDARPELHVERAIHMADTSQSARQIWVTLAHPEKRRERRRTEKIAGLAGIARLATPAVRPASRGPTATADTSSS